MKKDEIVVLLNQINPQIPNLTHLLVNKLIGLKMIAMRFSNPMQAYMFINFSQIRDLWFYLMQHDHDPI